MTRQIPAHPFPLCLSADKARHSHLSTRAAVIFGLAASLTACSPYRPALEHDHRLALAGFTAHPADTTARWRMMTLLPPNTLTYRPSSLGPIMLYADPIACGCVYFGDQNAYRAYVQTRPDVRQKERDMTAEIAQHPGWDWSVWQHTADPDVVAGIRTAY